MSGDTIIATFSGEQVFLDYFEKIDTTLSNTAGLLIIIALCILVYFFTNFIFGRGVQRNGSNFN